MRRYILTFFSLMLASSSVFAYGSVRSPYVTEGELSFELEGKRSSDHRKALNNAQSHSIELGYGLTDRLKLEIEGEQQRQSGDSLSLRGSAIAARYALATPGEYWIDSAIYAAYGWTEDKHDPQVATIGLLAQKQWGDIIHRANIFIDREAGANRQGGVEIETRYLALYDYDKRLRPGIEWQAEWGNIHEFKGWNDQGQHLGPALYGVLPIALWDNHRLKYEASHLIGLSSSAPDHATRLKLEYTIQF